MVSAKRYLHYVNEGYNYKEFRKWVKLIKKLSGKGMVVFKVEEIFNLTSGPDAGKAHLLITLIIL